MNPTEPLVIQTQKIPNNISLDKRVWQVYNELQKTVDNMDKRVQLVMKKHQSQFLHAYRTHIHKIRHQLQDIKNKSQQQEKMFSSNDRIRYLEKENGLFRQQALKLYANLQKKTIQLDIAKNKAVQAQCLSKRLQIQNKELSLQVKRLTSAQNDYNRTIEQLIKQKEQAIRKLQKTQQKRSIQKKRRDYMQSARTSSLGKSRDFQPKQFKVYRNQLQQWFLQCIRSVKRQIHQRKNNTETIDLNKINNINDFRLVDKLRLFEMILENQKLLNWLYNKIFPGRYQKLTDYLSQGATVPETFQNNNSQPQMSQRYGSLEQNFQLPRVPVKRVPSFSLRNQIVIKNGKMNISIA